MTITSLNDVFQADGFAGQLSADRSAQELVLVEDPDLPHVARVIANDHVLADVRRQGQVEIPETVEMNAVALNSSRPGDGQQQEIELFERVWQPRQKSIGLPACLRRNACFAMDVLVVLVYQPSAKARVEF